jgi:hypothetical protein
MHKVIHSGTAGTASNGVRIKYSETLDLLFVMIRLTDGQAIFWVINPFTNVIAQSYSIATSIVNLNVAFTVGNYFWYLH